MAKIYPAPNIEVPLPIHDYPNDDYEKRQKKENKYLDDLKTYLRSQDDGELVGEIVRHGVGDGYALYMIASHRPFSMVHLDLGDGYSAGDPWERGFRISDAKSQIAWEKQINNIIAK